MASLLSHQPVALISCYDKSGLDTLVPALVNTYGYQILSTGGTADYIRSLGLPVIETTELTGFKELAGGRVKSLHPTLFAGILDPRDPEASAESKPEFWIDLVVANLYPFEAMKNAGKQELIEYIDVGGPSLLRAAAKNHAWVTVLCQPSQYAACLQELKLGEGETSLSYRKHLAGSVFSLTAAYDTCIAQVFESAPNTEPTPTNLPSNLPSTLPFTLHQCQPLRYGENPQQAAALYSLNSNPNNETGFTLLQGKALSYNNLLDAFAAWNLIHEFDPDDQTACAIIKHNNPCGVALGSTPLEAWERALSVDSLSAFGGIVAFNQPITASVAKGLTQLFLEVVMAPEVNEEALAILSSKPNLRVLTRSWETPLAQWDIRVLDSERVLVQQAVSAPSLNTLNGDAGDETDQWQVVTEAQPTPQQWADIDLAWKVAKHVKSNGMILAKNGRTVGLGMGQTSRIGALEIALRQACDDAQGSVLASDGFIPALDNVHAALQGRVAVIVQPGGSVKDADVIALANQHQLPMVTTGVRVFRH
ncbi:MAG: bifunctional phosphoribosylaminoimidazolecarboxamide formyltransferase/IMP cyclohydrolase [Vampirovibrionales bacterium]